MLAQKVVIVNWSGIGKRLKFVHPLTADVIATSLVFSCDMWRSVMHGSLPAESHIQCAC